MRGRKDGALAETNQGPSLELKRWSLTGRERCNPVGGDLGGDGGARGGRSKQIERCRQERSRGFGWMSRRIDELFWSGLYGR